MNKIILLLIVVAVAGASAFSGLFTPAKKGGGELAVATSTSCIDEGAPIIGDNVIYPPGGTQYYDLIKSDARVEEPGKFEEMQQDINGAVDSNGHPIYTMDSSNYFGQATDRNLIFVLQNPEVPPQPPFKFKIYLKRGELIPLYITDCKSQTTGGVIPVVAGATAFFPPSAFNRTEITEIIGLLDPTVANAYIYNGLPPTTLTFVNGLGARKVGSLPIPSKGNLPLYFHNGTMFLIDRNDDAYRYSPTDTQLDLSPAKNSLQLKKIVFVQTPKYSWWTPSCKPAIYLYPSKKQNVNVKVNTTGLFTLTIPDYNKLTGWDVVANPDGVLEAGGSQYPYLYYESKVPDSKITKPKNGYVIQSEGLKTLFQTLLPKLGLNNKEMKEFIDYWTKALPVSPYYFVGVMDEKSIDQIEPLDITPNPNSIIRVRLYFELLEKAINVDKPEISTPKREGFTVVEWGGMVKTDKDNLFTCSQ